MALDFSTRVEITNPLKNIQHLSIQVEYSDRQEVRIIDIGAHEILVDLAKAMAWIVCAIRLTYPQRPSLSTFEFTVNHMASPEMKSIRTGRDLMRPHLITHRA